jgi:hypothetical protein
MVHPSGAPIGARDQTVADSCTRRIFLALSTCATVPMSLSLDRSSETAVDPRAVQLPLSPDFSWEKAKALNDAAQAMVGGHPCIPNEAAVLASAALLHGVSLPDLHTAFQYQSERLKTDPLACQSGPNHLTIPLVPWVRAQLAVAAVCSGQEIADVHSLYRALLSSLSYDHFGAARLTALAVIAGETSPDGILNRHEQATNQLKQNERSPWIAAHNLAGASLVAQKDVAELVEVFQKVPPTFYVVDSILVAAATICNRPIGEIVHACSDVQNWDLYTRISAGIGACATGTAIDSVNQLLKKDEFSSPTGNHQPKRYSPRLVAAALMAQNAPANALAVIPLL